jgi:N-acetyl-anhydromuramyl-L-alanine amidase AmpD
MRITLPIIAFLSLCISPLYAQTTKHQPIYNHTFDAYFEQAYNAYPSLPRGVLEAIAYTNTRIYHHLPSADPEHQSCIGLPPTYGVMGLMDNGKNWFRENIKTVAQYSGYSVADLKQSPQKNIMGFAAAFDKILKNSPNQQNNGINNPKNCQPCAIEPESAVIEAIRQLSELPYIASEVKNDFAMNSHLYSVLYHLNLPQFQQQYHLPPYQLNLKQIFGAENYALVSARQLDLSHEYEQNISEEWTKSENLPSQAKPQNQTQEAQEAQQLQVVCTMPSGPAEFPSAVTFDEPSDNYSGAIAPYTIAIHDMEGTYAGAISWFNNPISDVSAHYCMRNFDGQVTQMVCHRRKAWHVSAENPYAVGIEHEGIAAQGEAWYSQTMYQTSAQLTLFIASDIGVNTLQTYDGPPTSALMPLSHTCTKIKGHQMFPNNSHSDPGIAWDWPYYYTLLNNLPAPMATYTTASGTIYDSGGSAGNYADEERKTWLIQPSGTPATNITLTFTAYSVENNYDYLWIYDGNDNTGALIGKYSGTSPGTVTAYSGAMFLEFRSDCATNQTGWAASYTSSTTAPTCAMPSTLTATPSALHCTLNWSSVSGASQYELSWKRTLESTWTTQTLSGTSYILTGLTAGATYDCRIRTICSAGVYSAYKGEYFITTDPGLSVTTAGSYTVNQCEGTFKDSGGTAYHYSNYENWTYTIAPAGATSVTLVFTSFETEANYDYLYIYNGATTAAPLIGTYHGTTSPGTIVSSGGAITLRFTSDNATTKPGWAATWTCGQSTTCIPTTAIAPLNEWQTDDFSATFTDTDACTSGGLSRFYLVSEYNANDWTANNTIGFFNESADAAALNAQWVNNGGTWAQASGSITQSNQTNTNTNLYAPLTTDNTATYLFHTRMRIGGTGTNRRAGFHFFCSDPTQTQRGNSYMVYYRADNDKIQIYEAAANTIGNPKTDDNATIDPNIWYDCKVTYNPTSGLIKVYLDDVLKSQWTATAPHQTGGYLSLRTGECTADYDFFHVYKSRSTAQTVSVGTNASDMVRYQNSNPAENHAQIKSIVLDNTEKWSAIATQTAKIDWTAPAAVTVNDGTGTDIDLSPNANQLSANWTTSSDSHSDINTYWYAIGTTPGGNNIVDWTNNGNSTTLTISPITLLVGTTYYVSVKAQNNAGLYSTVANSDGFMICVPSTIVNDIAEWQTDDFTANFTDTDCGVGIKSRFYCVTDFDGSEWRGNGQAGYFYDQFTSTIHPDWTAATGTWAINNNTLYQSDATQNNTNIYATVQQTAAYTYLYEWDAKIGGAGTNRRMGLHIFSDNPSLTERGNSYFIWYRADNDKLQFYKSTANVFEMVLEINLTVDIDIWQHYAITYNPTSGEVLMFRDGALLASWTDTAPLTAGTGVSFRTGNSEMWVDNFAVHHSRPSTTGLVSIGTASPDAVRYQSPNPTTVVGKVTSVLLNNSHIFAPQHSETFKVDWTAPNAVTVNDGLSTDIDQSTNNTQLQANWTAATDVNSGVVLYEYAIGTTASGTDIVNWTSNGTNTNLTVTGLALNNGTTYYISIRAKNGVNLYATVATSDGVTIVLPCAVPTQLTASNTTTTSGTLQWTAVGNALSYEIRYRLQGASTWNTINVGNVTTYTINALSPCSIYEVQIQSNCSGGTTSGYSSSITFTTSALSPAWTAPAPLKTCDAAINLNNYLTGDTGGTWSGSGVSGNMFNPSTLSVGNYNITYTVGTSCVATETHSITLNAAPTATWSATNLQTCSAAIDLNTLVTGTTGGTFSGTGVTNNTFNPNALSVGTYNITYTVGSGTCQTYQTNAINVTNAPTAAWNAPSTAIAPCNGSLNLNNLITGTTGGTFSGTGVTSNTFNPNALSVGTYNITYTVGSGTCQSTQTHPISVTNSPTATWTAPPALKNCDNAIDLNALITGITGGTFSGTGVTSNTFNPNGVTPNTYNITYTVGTGTCQVSQINTITVSASPSAAWSVPASLAPCNSAINLNSYITGTTGGTFSGTGVTSNSFNPAALSPSNYNITYTVGTGTCQTTQTNAITVTASPTANWNTASVAQCAGLLNLTTLLTGTTGGTWSGTGVSGNNFNPSALSPNNYNITYTVGTGTCQVAQTNAITVTAAPIATWTAPSGLFTCSTPLSLNSYITGTSGGTFSGTGVTNNTFDPSNLSAATYTITYTVGSGACQATQSNAVVVTQAPNAAWTTPASIATCNTAIDLNIYITGTTGGTFSGTGVSNNAFNPNGLSPDNYNITYTVGSTSCATSETHAINVVAAPSANWTTFSTAQCSPSTNLNTLITGTTGGTFSGTGVSNNVFNPSGLSAGNYNITYTVGTGTCQATQTHAVTLSNAPSAAWTTPASLAPCNSAINLSTYITGTTGGTFSGIGVTNNTFSPNGLSAGNYNVTYTVGTGTCQTIQTNAITVTTSPSAAWTTPTSLAPCNSAINLNSYITGTTGGTFSGTGVTSNTFNPSALSVGNYNVTYTVGTGTCQTTQTNAITVTTSPTANWTTFSTMACSPATALNTYITGTSGGTFSGTGVTSNSFNPSGLSAGNYNVTYTVGSGTCQTTQTNAVTVTASPNPNWTTFSTVQCNSASNLNTYITGTTGGTWSGTGVSGNTFNPSGLNVGNYNVTYTVGSGTCQYSQIHAVTVTASPSANWTVPAILQNCDNPLNLNTLVTGTTGGTFSGTGVSNNTLNPALLSPGTYNITYTVGTGTCQTSKTNIITINPSPSATWTTFSTAQCSGTTNLNTLITGTSGGTFSGTGVTSNSFNPSGLSAGNYNVTYTVGSGTCQTIQTNAITVTTSPSAAWTTPTSLAPCNSAINLSTYVTGTSGGTFSGIGVTSNSFNPSGLSAGNYNVTYTVGSGTCQTIQTNAITVTTSPSAAWVAPSAVQNCDLPINLNSLIDNNATTGGNWYGTAGINQNNFEPMGLAPGNYSITYTVGQGSCQTEKTNIITVSACQPAGINLKVKLWLQGAYQVSTNSMSNALRSTAPNLIPLAQPYNANPWNYAGTETVSNNNLHANTVDWVLVELLHPTTNALIASQAALLRSDASVWNIWGGEGVYFNVANGNYRVVVRHRNHLALATANAITLPTANTIDFSVASNVLGGTNQLIDLHNNGTKYGLCAGDINANGIINVADYNVFQSQIATVNQYKSADITLNRSVLLDDFNMYQPNASKIGVTIIRY